MRGSPSVSTLISSTRLATCWVDAQPRPSIRCKSSHGLIVMTSSDSPRQMTWRCFTVYVNYPVSDACGGMGTRSACCLAVYIEFIQVPLKAIHTETHNLRLQIFHWAWCSDKIMKAKQEGKEVMPIALNINGESIWFDISTYRLVNLVKAGSHPSIKKPRLWKIQSLLKFSD